MQLPVLQGLIRRDPESYRDEFVLQKNHLEAELQLLQLKPSKDSDRLVELMDFVSHTVVCYKEDAEEFLTKLYALLEAHAFALHPSVRLKIFQSLVLVKNKIQSDPLILIKIAFKLFALNDKQFRVYLSQFLFNDIKSISKTKFIPAYHRAIQSFLYRFVSEETSVLVSQKSMELLSELYRHKIWTDAKTVNIIATAIQNPSYRVYMTAIHFFLGIEQKISEDEEVEKEKIEKKKIELNMHEHTRKTRKRERLLEKQSLKLTKLNKELERMKNGEPVKEAQPLLPAIMMIHNPQEIAEYLLKKLKSQYESFEHKLHMMNFLSQLIGCHKLVLLSFYSFLLKYITSHQQYVTNIFVFLIQSCHDYIPPEDILPIVKTIAYQFITERSSDENIALGINTVRELFIRIPAVLLEEEIKDLIQDLVLYTHKSKKCVMAAARSLLNFIRAHHPGLLRTRDRGRDTDMERKPLAYGQTTCVDSADLFKALAETNSDGEEEEEEDEWEEMEEEGEEGEGSDDEEEDDEGEWEEVSENEEEVDDEMGEWQEVEENENEEGDEEEGEWESVNEDDNDEEEEDNEEEEEEAALPIAKKPKTIHGDIRNNLRHCLDISKILSSDDMIMIQQMKALRRAAGSNSVTSGSIRGSIRGSANGENEEDDDEDEDDNEEELPDYVVDASSLLPTGRANKLSKIERIKHVLEGRQELRFTSTHAGGLTNKEKLRKKNFMMVRKGKKSLLEKSRGKTSGKRAAQKENEKFGRDKRKRRRT